MSEEQANYLTRIHERDQDDAAIAAITTAVARHYTAMIAAGMCELSAVTLCQGFQHDLMGSDGATIMLVGGEVDD